MCVCASCTVTGIKVGGLRSSTSGLLSAERVRSGRSRQGEEQQQQQQTCSIEITRTGLGGEGDLAAGGNVAVVERERGVVFSHAAVPSRSCRGLDVSCTR